MACRISTNWTSRCEELLYFFGSHKAAGLLGKHKFLETSFNYCKQLFERDGDIVIIDNYGQQELCDSYPIQIILPKSFVEYIENNNDINNQHIDINCNDFLCRLIERARYARVHRRFVVPVIFVNNACIARSSTLSTTGELLLNKATTVVSEALNYCPNNNTESPMGHDLNALRTADIKLLKYFNIKFIADLMVEDKKKVGWGRYTLTVTSSEKVDREQRYKDFNISSIPYPGCEFFKLYKNNGHNANKLVFEWNNEIHDAKLTLNNNKLNNTTTLIDINWSEYETWDIITLTQNYLRLIINYIQNNNDMGILIHCISGWDRTPLFISLLRISLWADNVIHNNLNSSEILYLTLSYDWLLFTHQFGNRLIKGEDIFHFTFYMIQYLCHQKYSIHTNNTTNKKKKKKKILTNIIPSKSVTNILSAESDWESKGCGPLSSTIRNSYIPTLLTPPSFTKNRNILPVSLNIENNNNNTPPPKPLQLVKTQPIVTVNTNKISNKIIRNFRLQSWQFVDQKNDSPMFQFISTPKSDPCKHENHHSAPPALNLDTNNNNTNNNNNNNNTKYSLSAPSSTKKSNNFLHFRDLIINGTPSPEIIAHPETNIIDMHESMSKEEINDCDITDDDITGNIATALVDDVIQNVYKNYINDNTIKSAKSTPVTISDFLGLDDGIGVHDSISNDLTPQLKKVESFEINVDEVLNPIDNQNEYNKNENNKNENNKNENNNRSDRLMQVYTLFNKIYTQVMIINDPPSFYKQSVQNQMNNDLNCSDNIDFISSDKYNSYFTNQQSDSYNNITTYLKSILPTVLIGNNDTTIDQYDDEYDD